MALKNVLLPGVCTLLLAWSGVSMADEYRPDQFLGLDLSKAVLSPKPLGPPAAFAPVPVEAKTDRSSEGQQAEAEHIRHPRVHVAHSRMAMSQPKPPRSKARLAQVNTKPHPAPHTHAAPPVRLARQHRNPLDAQALDTRIQIWPCRSGGICNWK